MELLTSEYDLAGQRFFAAGVKALMEAQGGVYSLVSKESMEHLPDYSIPLPDNDVLRGRPIEATSLVVVNYDDVINGRYDSILASMNHMAVEMVGQITEGILVHISDICSKTGNVMTGELSSGLLTWQPISLRRHGGDLLTCARHRPARTDGMRKIDARP